MRQRSAIFAAALCALSACQAPPPSAPAGDEVAGTAIGRQGSKLYRAVEQHVREQGSELGDIAHQFAYVDLDSDGLMDVLLLLADARWCIGDACTLIVFRGTDEGAQVLSELSLIGAPISIGAVGAEGWRDLYVSLPGQNGSRDGARVPANGGRYPSSPSEWRFLTPGDGLPGRAVLLPGQPHSREIANLDSALSAIGAGEQGAATAAVGSAVETAAATPVAADQALRALLAEADELAGVHSANAPPNAGEAVATAAGSGEAGSDLLAAVEPPAPPALPARARNWHGRYSWGPGEAYFRPCGGSLVFWVSAGEAAAAALDHRYREIANMQFDDVFVALVARAQPPPAEGEASYYDGVLEVEQLLQMSSNDSEACSRAPLG